VLDEEQRDHLGRLGSASLNGVVKFSRCCGQSTTLDGVDDVEVDNAECLAEFWCRWGMIDGEQRSEQAPVDLGVEHDHPHAVVAERVGVGTRKTFGSGLCVSGDAKS
jgi:hypothetical protein